MEYLQNLAINYSTFKPEELEFSNAFMKMWNLYSGPLSDVRIHAPFLKTIILL